MPLTDVVGFYGSVTSYRKLVLYIVEPCSCGDFKRVNVEIKFRSAIKSKISRYSQVKLSNNLVGNEISGVW